MMLTIADADADAGASASAGANTKRVFDVVRDRWNNENS